MFDCKKSFWVARGEIAANKMGRNKKERKKEKKESQGTVVLGVNTCLVFTWMRKVVGSNLGDDNIRSLFFAETT